VDFTRYAERSAGLLNADLGDLDALRRFLDTGTRDWLLDQASDRDCMLLRKFQRELRPVFLASAEGDVDELVELLNDLMVRHPITPRIHRHGDGPLHIHAAAKSQSVAELLVGEALIGLSNLVCDLGPSRLGVCAGSNCENVYVDTSPNQSRRYCSERCSSRANVAAYRARQRGATA
jgi:predicted RNA-binding Zn ribbon-like protein